MRNWFKTCVGTWESSSPTLRVKKAGRHRPKLEELENRCLPADLTWTGAVSSNFNLAANWKLANGQVSPAGPTSNDELTIGAPVKQNNDPVVNANTVAMAKDFTIEAGG